MVKTYTAPDQGNVSCPSCGAMIKAPPSPRSRRVQCPKCREIVVLEDASPPPPPPKKARSVAEPDTAKERSSADALEARIAALEAAVSALIATIPGGGRAGDRKRFVWATSNAEDPMRAFASERDQALSHNLGTVKAREITIRIPAENPAAKERAVCFREIFERAGWTVRGPEETAADAVAMSLALGVPDLPVGREAAETYLALKAAGFDPVPVLDATLADNAKTVALSLTLPAEKSA